MFKILTGLAAAFFLASTACAQDDYEARMALAQETMQLSGADGMVTQMLDMMMPTMEPALRQQYPGADDAQVQAALDLIAGAFNAAAPEMVEASAQVYAENFTAEELAAINAFYRTQAGEKLTELLPVITQETSLVGQRIGMRVMQSINPRVVEIMAGDAAAE